MPTNLRSIVVSSCDCQASLSAKALKLHHSSLFFSINHKQHFGTSRFLALHHCSNIVALYTEAASSIMSNNNYRLWQARKIIVEKQKATARDNAAVWNSTEQDKPTLTTLPAEVRNSSTFTSRCVDIVQTTDMISQSTTTLSAESRRSPSPEHRREESKATRVPSLQTCSAPAS